MNSVPSFTDFFQEARGYPPFQWQEDLANQVLQDDQWPEVVDLPTGAGKTAVIEIALWWIACKGQRPPRRIIYVVDRRLLVDSAYELGTKLAEKLATNPGQSTALGWVAAKLKDLAGPRAERPLEVVRLRGGGFVERQWATSPLQPTLVFSTVDQIGSRLLFRGYGYARDATNELSVHAALACCDAIWFVDEAHLSDAFLNTLRAIEAMRKVYEPKDIVGFWQVVELTATPRPGRTTSPWRPSTLQDIHQRLAAPKPLVKLLKIGKEDIPSAMIDAAGDKLLGSASSSAVVAVVCNRVLRARRVFEEAKKRQHEAILLTGRVRPLDRERILRQYLDRMKADRDRTKDQSPLLVVATQTIEVGADLDFDAMVTEAAPLDALLQRLGRLNRLGKLQQAPVVVVAIEDDLKAREDPVYGEALKGAWKILKGFGPGYDLGWNSFGNTVQQQVTAPNGQQWRAALSPLREAPELLPAHLDLLAQTSPLPMPDPDIDPLLHGFESGPAEVSLLWRADLDPKAPERWAEIGALVPPSVHEAMDLPIWAVRSWLSRAKARDLADVEGEEELRSGEEGASPRPFLRWLGTEQEAELLADPDQIRPGDTILVPAAYGGCDEFGWCPWSEDAVEDLAELARLQANTADRLRLHRATLKQWLDRADCEEATELLQTMVQASQGGDREQLSAAQDSLLDLLAQRAKVAEIRGFAGDLLRRRLKRVAYPDGSGFVLMAPPNAGSAGHRSRSYAVGQPVKLVDHCTSVAELARETAEKLGLGLRLASDLELAGLLHDVGKAHLNFQVMLYGGDVAAASAGPALAKSGMDPRDTEALRQARQQAQLPRGWRHESLSVALTEGWLRSSGYCHDRELVLHLLASHHGAARPFLPPTPPSLVGNVTVTFPSGIQLTGQDQELWRIDSGVAERFWKLVRKYGWWGLALLEAILRMADWEVSQLQQTTRGGNRP